MEPSQTSEYLVYWRELTESIEKLIDMTRPITLGHERQRALNGKNAQWPQEEQLAKVTEECFEIIKADYHEGKEAYDEENLDLLFATLCQLHKASLSGIDLKFAVGTCLAKFQKRGWLF